MADQLRTAILTGELSPGQPLPTERELCDLFGASRASIREAIRLLLAQGLIDQNPQGGGRPTITTTGSIRSLRDALVNLLHLQGVPLDDLVDFRCVLETAALQRAAGNASRDLAKAREALEAIQKPNLTASEFHEADISFHVCLIEASENTAMHSVALAVRYPIEQHLLNALESTPDKPRVFDQLNAEHTAILQAVEAGDGRLAALLVEKHIRRFYGSFR